jgi:hypothetical protein
MKKLGEEATMAVKKRRRARLRENSPNIEEKGPRREGSEANIDNPHMEEYKDESVWRREREEVVVVEVEYLCNVDEWMVADAEGSGANAAAGEHCCCRAFIAWLVGWLKEIGEGNRRRDEKEPKEGKLRNG